MLICIGVITFDIDKYAVCLVAEIYYVLGGLVSLSQPFLHFQFHKNNNPNFSFK